MLVVQIWDIVEFGRVWKDKKKILVRKENVRKQSLNWTLKKFNKEKKES